MATAATAPTDSVRAANTGRVSQVIGAVVDVAFDSELVEIISGAEAP